VTVVGHTPAVSAGEWITASGIWISDRTHGLQFKAEVLKTTPPTGVEGIEKYLASGQMRGIGPAMAKRIVAAFGIDTFEIIEAAPERLTEVSGIGPMRASRIVSGWAEQKAVREIMIFLHAHGVGTARAVRIFKTYGYEAIQVMTEDPYRLARDVRGSASEQPMPLRPSSAWKRPPLSEFEQAFPLRSRRQPTRATVLCRSRPSLDWPSSCSRWMRH
jgi:exodeoxyribonuclease V alpha subunit